MKRRINLVVKAAFALLFSVFVLAYGEAQIKAFPGADGHGAYTTGGRGGVVYEVTNLNDSGTGSLRAAINASGARTVVFKVSGTIYLESKLQISNGNITIAGQTAPGDGITLANYALNVNANNVIVRFIRCRFGDTYLVEDDAMNGRNCSNIIIDHCTMSWSIDEAASFYDNENFTMQWCIISESLYASGHVKGNHGYGGIWGGMGASFHHNLLAHHTSRNPRFCGARYHQATADQEIVDFRNNVIYNWGYNSAYGGEYGNFNMVNNYYKSGPATGTGSVRYRIIQPSYGSDMDLPSKWYVTGNYVNGYSSVTANNWDGGVQPQSYSLTEIKSTAEFPTGSVTTHTALDAYDVVLDYAGACFPFRDEIDTRIVSEVENGTATYGGEYGTEKGIIDKPSDVGGWPTLTSGTSPADSDSDGMPDEWETANGLNSADASDRNTTNAEGYTMLEVYLNSLVANIMDAGLAGGEVVEIEADEEVSSVTLAKSTCTVASGTVSPWSFIGGYTITNENSKTYATGNENGIKFSSSIQYTVNLPEGVSVASIEFSGYDNYTDVDAYLGELNGATYNATDYVFTQKDASGNYTVESHVIDFDTPVSGSFTFTFEGKQVVIAMELSFATTTTVDSPKIIEENQYDIVDVYGIDGCLVRSQVLRKDASKNLPNGVYIIGGKKIGIYR